MVHPKVIEEYNKADYEYVELAHDKAEAIFDIFQKTSQLKGYLKILRQKSTNSQEYI